MRKYRKFDEGGPTYGEDERPAPTGMSEAAELMPEKPKGFKDAFREARSAGDKTFTWQGKKYTTEMAGSKTAPPSGTPGGAYRGQRAEALAPKASSSDIPKGKESAPESTGEDTSGPSNLDRILMGTGVGAGIAGIAGAAKLAQMRRAKQAAEMSKAAAAKFSQPQARQIATQTGVKKQPAEQIKKEPPAPAKDSSETASPRKSRNIFERRKSDTDTAPTTPPKRPGPKKPEVSASDKSSKTPRGRSSYRDDADVEFRRGGATKAYTSGGSVKGAGIAQRGVKRCKFV